MRILVIGLDGGTWNFLNPLMDEGFMPYLRKLSEEGTSGILKSTIPPLTAVAWVSFQTGVMPGKHGVYGFQSLARMPQGFKFKMTNASSIKAKTFWEYANSFGKRVGIVNLPMTYPPSPINGFLVTGFPTPSQRAEFTYPQALKKELLKAIPDYRVPTPDFGRGIREDRVADYVERLIRMAKARAQAALFLMHKHPWEIMVLQFQETDFLQHPLWHHLDHSHSHFSQEKHQIVGRFFQEVDELIRLISEQLSENDLLMIVSDHGFQSMKKIFYPNRWLHREGYLKISVKPKAFVYRATLNSLRSLDIFKLRRAFVRNSIREHLTGELVEREFNWERSFAYAYAAHTSDFNLYLTTSNSKAREDLIKRLYEIKDPETDEKVVDRVLTAREAFGSELTAEAPDLVACLREGYVAVPHIELRRGPLFESREPGQDYQIGVHHPDGIILAKGPMIKQGWNSLKADIIDIAPTILYHLDLPIPSYMDGKILREMYNPEFLKGKETEFIEDEGVGMEESKELTEEEEEQIRKHLQDLGYLD